MSDRRTKEILQQVQAGTLPVEQAMLQLKLSPSRTWAMPRWTTTGGCARGCRR